MSNPYLEKIASKNESSGRGPTGEVVEGLVGAYTASHAPSRLLGYHTVYHGTPSAKAAKNIKQNGLRRSYGGTAGSKVGAGSVQDTFVNEAKKHVYVTKDPLIAATFAGDSAKHINTHGIYSGEAAHAALKQYVTGEGKVLKARIPHNVWEKRFEMDPDSFDFNTRFSTPKETLKRSAARSKKDIPSHLFAGGKGSRGPLTFLKANHLRKYYASAGGRARGGKGAALGLAGTALMGHAALSNYSRNGVLSNLKRDRE